ncbi:hypothetical protein DY000_02009477 [Brassica cretica]|uniref:Uncharacterized protein n=1 Tax=Brassica cretica TaxID=69181 RepID=A0ABQ7C3B8_BRACR|nr:hypothetical protein DY000_02009477 [Brassica cretica]
MKCKGSLLKVYLCDTVVADFRRKFNASLSTPVVVLITTVTQNEFVTYTITYRVEIFVYGNGDSATFVLLGDSGAEPIGREVSELMDNYGEADGSNGKPSNPAMSCDEENKANHPCAST